MSSFGKLLSITSSDETNLLASIEYSNILNTHNIYRLYPKDRKKDIFVNAQQGKILFGKGITATYIQSALLAGASFKPSTLSEAFTFEHFQQTYPKALVLCVINKHGRLKFFHESHTLKPQPGSIIISLRS